MGQPQNVSEIKFGRATNHLWLLPDLDLASAPNLPMPQSIALPFQYLIGVIAAGGKPAPAPPAVTPTAQRRQTPAPSSNPEDLLTEAMRSVEAYQLHFRQTGDVAGMPAALGPARDKAQAAYGQFLAKRDYAKAAQSLITVADIDRMLTMAHPEEYQVKQAPVHQQYADALKLADQANDVTTQFKAVMGLARAELNSKDYAAAGDHISKAIELAVRSADKDNLFKAYETRAELESKRGNLSAASDYLDRALSMSGEVKDRSLVYFGYSDRADIYNGRADQCDFERRVRSTARRRLTWASDDTQKGDSK